MRSARALTRRSLPLAVALLAACTAVPLPREGTYHPSDADLAVTRILHGSLVLELSKTTVLVDPWFHSSIWTRQTEPLGLTPEHLPPVAAVLLTNRHAGHFDDEALADLAKHTSRVIAPPALADRLSALGFTDVTPLEWWSDTMIGPIRVTAVPAGRSGNQNSYVLAGDRVRVFIADESPRTDGLVDVATAFPNIDVAFLPVGGKVMLGFARTMGPQEAAQAAILLNPRRVVPIGFGAAGGFPFVWYARDPIPTFDGLVAAGGFKSERVVPLTTGESWHYYR
jgi:L-ascorbate metabolism protein UlaG (beta-lactamase superfamily)